MRRLTILVIAAACLYSIYWFVGASRIEDGAKAALAQMQADGWEVSHTDLATRGYPSRFDTTITELGLQPPDGSWRYTTPFAQAFTLSYRPTHVIAAFADTHELMTTDQKIAIASDGLRASGAVSAGPNLPLKEITIEAATLAFSSSIGWQLGIEGVLLALRPKPDKALNYDLYLGVAQMQPSQGSPLSDLKFDATIQLDRTLDRHLAADASPKIEMIEVRAIQMVWDGIQVNGAGELTVDGAGVPFGEIEFKTTDWQKLVPSLSASGLIPPQFQIMAETVLQNLANDNGTLDIPLRFENGMMQLGPFPLGPAPRLR